MKIPLDTIDKSSFKIKDGILNGRVVYLINPVEFDCKWNKSNLHLRSLMIDYDGTVISRGMSKFFNFGEKQELYPTPDKFNDWVLSSKEDGSLLICDLIDGKFNARTRGTISYKDHENTSDFDFVINKYKLWELSELTEYSILFELYSPTNVIVLKPYQDPEIVLLGAIHKENNIYYPYYSELGKQIQSKLNCKLPETFPINGDIAIIASKIKDWIGKEGIVLNYNNNQNQLKIKSDWYLIRHRMKSELSSLEKVMDLWISLNYPNYTDFYNEVVKSFDFEIANIAQGHISNICDAYKEVNKILDGFYSFVNHTLRLLPNRKEQALKVIQSYGITNRANFIFKLLDGKTLGGDDIKKLLFQVLKS